VQHDGERRRNVNKFAIHLYVVANVRFCAEVSTGFTINSDLSRCDQLVAVPARSQTRSGEEAI